MLGLLPLFLLSFGTGASEAARSALSSDRVCTAALAIYALFALMNVTVIIKAVWLDRGHFAQSWDPSEGLSLTLKFIESKLESDAVIAGPDPELCFLYTGRRSFPTTEEDDGWAGRFGRTDKFLRWMKAAEGHTIYLLGKCPENDVTTAAIIRLPKMVSKQIYHTPDCKYSIYSLVKDKK